MQVLSADTHHNARPEEPVGTKGVIIVGIDPGLATAGVYAIRLFPGGKCKPVAAATYRSKRRSKGQRKATWLAQSQAVGAWLKDHAPPAALVVMEDFVWVGRRRRSAYNVCKVVGYLAKQYPDVMIFGPGQWRKALAKCLTESARWAKAERRLRRIMPPTTPHADDALGMALLGCIIWERNH